MAKKKTENKKPSKKMKVKKRGLVFRFFKWCLVVAIWCGLAATALVAWYAGEVPNLIEDLRFDRETAITIQAADGSTLATYGDLKGSNVHSYDLPPHLIYAVIATEDRRFYNHHGIDPMGIARAMYVNLRERRFVQGGSTITQQLAKNLFLSHDRTFKRKIQEAILALWLENQLSKDEILSAYLNRVYLGSGAYGVDAASRLYFGKTATDVTLEEAALLAGLLKAPSRYSPHSNPHLAAKRAQVVLQAMADAGYISGDQVQTRTFDTPLPEKKPQEGQSKYYFTDWITASLNGLIGTPREDLTIQTTFNPAIQETAETVLNKVLRENGEERNMTQGAILVMGHDGAVLAMVGGRNHTSSQFNRTTQALRPPGSSFKPIVYLTALQNDYDPDDIIEDTPITNGDYRPKNFKDEYFGNVTLTTALTLSLNAATVRLAKQLELGPIIKTARTLGINSGLERDLSLSLGSSGVPMLEMVTAYATIANGGYRITPYAIREIRGDNGSIFYARVPLKPVRPAIKESAIEDLDSMLRSVVREGTGRAAALRSETVAGKTGTSQDFRDAWFIGYTDDYIAAVWLGNDDNSPMNGVTGGSFPARIWRDVIGSLYEQDLKKPDRFLPSDRGFTGLLNRIFED